MTYLGRFVDAIPREDAKPGCTRRLAGGGESPSAEERRIGRPRLDAVAAQWSRAPKRLICAAARPSSATLSVAAPVAQWIEQRFALTNKASSSVRCLALSIRIPEVDAHPVAGRPVSSHRSELDLDAGAVQVRDRVVDRPGPHEAEIAPAWLHRELRDGRGLHAGAVHVELLSPEAVRPTRPDRDELGAQHVTVEGVRALPLAHVDHAVVEARLHPRGMLSGRRTAAGAGGPVGGDRSLLGAPLARRLPRARTRPGPSPGVGCRPRDRLGTGRSESVGCQT